MMATAITRGTTPPIALTVAGLDTSRIVQAWLTIVCGSVVINRDIGGLTLTQSGDDGAVTTVLTQEETLTLPNREGAPVKIQLRVLFDDGTAAATKQLDTTVGAILKDGVIA